MSHDDFEEPGEAPEPGAGYEKRDIRFKPVILFGVYLAAAAAVVHVFIWLLIGYFTSSAATTEVRQYPLANVGEAPLPPEPRLQVQPREELKALRAEEEAALEGYGWVDRANGVVRIPIDRAMELVLERGLPAREGAAPPPGPGAMPSKANSGRTAEAVRQ